MYRIKALNEDSDVEDEDDTRVTKEAEVFYYHNLTKYVASNRILRAFPQIECFYDEQFT